MTHIDINAIKSLLERYINETEEALKNREYSRENVGGVRKNLQNCKSALSLLNGEGERVGRRGMQAPVNTIPASDIREENR